MKKLIMVLCIVSLVSCAAPLHDKWHLNGKTVEQFHQDGRECFAYANQAVQQAKQQSNTVLQQASYLPAGNQLGLALSSEYTITTKRNEICHKCLEARGYTMSFEKK